MAEPRVVGLDLSLTATAYENPAPVAQLSKEARDLVLAKMDDVDRARARAAMDARTAVIL